MRFCPQCGAPLMAGAKFCVECGRQLGESAKEGGATATKSEGASAQRFQLTYAFIVVFLGITILGFGAAAFILTRPVPQLSPAPPAAQTADQSQSQSQSQTQDQSQAQANPNALPPGHPKVQLPTEARTMI